MSTNDYPIKIKEAIIVEGRYDKNTLSQYVSADIFETGGFQIFTRKDLIALIKKLANSSGVIILTDSDSAGFLIRNHIKGSISEGNIKHAYIPDIQGKERRKRSSSAEGKLGVEAMSKEVILKALRDAGATIEGVQQTQKSPKRVIMASLFELGLTGHPDSAARRRQLLKSLELPERLSAKAMLDVLNAVYSYDELVDILSMNILNTG